MSDDAAERLDTLGRRLAAGELKLVFIVGMSRSGTTWLSKLLDQEPTIVNLGESHLFTGYLKGLPRAVQHYRGNPAIGIKVACTEEAFLLSLRHLVLRTLLAPVLESPSCSIVVEKTPANTYQLPFIHRLLPEAYFLNIVRDPRAVVASWHAAGETWARHWARKGTIAIAQSWNRVTTDCDRFAGATDRFRLVTYERLHAEPVAELHGIHRWLGLDTTLEVCEAAVAACSIDKLRKPATATGRSTGVEFFRRGETEGWRDDLTPRQIARVEFVTRAQMARYGYRPSLPPAGRLPSLWLYDLAKVIEKNAERVARRLRV